MPDWLIEALEGFLEWVQGIFEDIRTGLIRFMTEMDWVHLSDLSWSTGKPLAAEFMVLAYVGYGLVIVVGGFIVMSHETIQTRYTVREIAPRLVAGLLLAGLSAILVQQAMEVNNSVVDGFSVIAVEANWSGVAYLEDFPQWLDPDAWENAESRYLKCVAESGEESCEKPNITVDILWILLTVICLLVLIFTAFIRNIAFFFVVVCAPVALACHGLPVTEWAARLWWRMLGACMASSIGQAALVWVYVKMTDTFYWGRLFHIQVVHLYLLVIVWMMWKIHQQAFLIARGRPLQIPGSRLAQALVMSKLMDSVNRSGKRSNNKGPQQPKPNQPKDRFPDLPPEPEGFKDWAQFRQGADEKAANTRPSAESAKTPVSPLSDAAPVRVDGQPNVGGSTAPYGPAETEARRPNPRLGPPASPMDDAAPPGGGEPIPPNSRAADDRLADVPDGALLPPKTSEPAAVTVRPEEAERLRERRAAAEQTHREYEADRTQQEAESRAEAEQRQAELRRKAAAAMTRMATGGPRAPAKVAPARLDQIPPPPKRTSDRGGGER